MRPDTLKIHETAEDPSGVSERDSRAFSLNLLILSYLVFYLSKLVPPPEVSQANHGH